MLSYRQNVWFIGLLTLATASMGLQSVRAALTSGPDPKMKTAESATVSETVSELLKLLNEKRLLATDDVHLRRALIKAIIDAVDCNAVLATDDGAEAPTAAEGGTVGATATVGGIFRYVQLISMGDAAAGELAGELGDIEYGHYEGVIVDLRYTGGDSIAGARKATEALVDSELPVVVLINRETVAAAEVFAALTQRKCQATVVGEPSRGYPFPWHRAELTSGEVLLLPQVAGAPDEGCWKPTPLQPDVLVKDQLSRQSLRASSTEPEVGTQIDKDACLRKAIDLLKVITALGSRHF